MEAHKGQVSINKYLKERNLTSKKEMQRYDQNVLFKYPLTSFTYTSDIYEKNCLNFKRDKRITS